MEENNHNTTEADAPERLTAEEMRLKELARMADKRRTATCPDAVLEWRRIAVRLPDDTPQPSCDNEPRPENNRLRRLRLWAIAATSAAAVLAGALLYVSFNKPAADGRIIALGYDETPQRITLIQDDDKITDLSSQDSLTYYNKVSAATPKEVRQQRLSTPRGMDFKLTLPDGSEVWLNAESSIKFPSSFISGERRVELSGEAYFKVARNARKPFIVATGRMNVKVLGTEFNMRSYKSEAPCVSLVKGSVIIINPDNHTAECRLKPGQDAWRDDNGTLHVSQADTYSVTQWVEGFFYFDDAPLVTILRDIGRWYNLGVVFSNATVANYKLHFSASRKDDINATLSSLSNIMKTRISVEGTNIVVR